ncbi:ATP-binding cassette domain-containing protein [Pasteurellaceae bacterium LIM206]|nr:ATP-binding cassette domain-containing protein [Pasteurellaceae bacterium LIM206]
MTVLIETKQLSVSTKAGTVLVEPISLNINEGRHLTILGETGSGKSLLAQAIMGALPDELVTAGEIKIERKALNGQALQQTWGRRLSMLPQEPTRSLDPTMKLLTQLWESFALVGGIESKKAMIKSEEKLTALGLQRFMQYYPHQLSGGMAQRASFAVATSGGAYMLIADEPTKGLDEKNKQIVINLLQQISAQGGAVLTITHDIDVAARLGGDIMVMRKGKLLEQGQANRVLSQPHSDYAKALMAAAPYHWSARSKAALSHSVLLTAKDLQVNRGSRRLFSNVNFTLRQGEILGLVGDSGIGKSSLGDVLCGLLEPKCGAVSWSFKPKRHQVLKLYQDPPAAFAPKVKLQTLLDDVIDKHHLDRGKIPYLLTQLKLEPDLLQRTAENVSGGELQRVAILRALLFEPVLLFADEVTSRLDPITQKETLDLLVEQCESHQCALVLVSHDHHLIRHYCHQVIDLSEYSY